MRVLLAGFVAMASAAGLVPPQADGRPPRQARTLPVRAVEARAVRATLDQMRANEHPRARTAGRAIERLLPPDPLPLPALGSSGADSVDADAVSGPSADAGAPAADVDLDLDSQPLSQATPVGPPALVRSFRGLVDPGTVIPPDTQGAPGTSHLVTLLNSEFAIYDKDAGTLLPGLPISLGAFWSPLGSAPGEPAENPFDPRVLYDQYSDRFILMSLGTPRDTPSWVLVAVSASPDPADGFFLYGLRNDVTTPGQWGDLPALGVDPDHIYISHNMFDTADEPVFTQSKFWVLDKAGPLSGGSLTGSEFLNPNAGSSWVPAHAFGPTAVNYVLDQGWLLSNPLRRFLRIQRFSFSGGAPSLSDLGFVEVPPYGFDSLQDAPQAGCSARIDVGSFRLQNAVFRDGMIWTTHSVDDPVADGVAKMEIDFYGFDPNTASFIEPVAFPAQHGRISDASRWYYFPAIAVNDEGSVALGFTGSSSTELAGSYVTARQSVDAAGTTWPVMTLKAGVDTYNKTFGSGRNRWGDFSAMAVDPSDGRTFWTLQEYAESEFFPGECSTDTGRWGTWWGALRFPECQIDLDCDDGRFCNGAESCDTAGQICLPGEPPLCEDGDPCTADACEAALDACVSSPLPDGERAGGGDGLCGTRDDNPALYGADGICATLDDLSGDGVCDAIDNCPAIVNPDQTDADGLAPGDACDCARTVEVRNLGIAFAAAGAPLTVLRWEPGGPEAATYSVYGAIQPDLGTIVCISGVLYDPIFEESFEPDPGVLVLYLAAAANSCGVEGTLGSSSAGIERRALDACP